MTLNSLQYFWGTKGNKLLLQKTALHAATGTVLGTLGPYNAANIDEAILRFAYWIGLLVFSGLISGPIARAIFPSLLAKGTSVKMSFLMFCAITSIPVFMLVLVLDISFVRIIFSETTPKTIADVFALLLEMPLGLLGYIFLYGQVLLVSLLALGAISLLANQYMPAPESNSPPQGIKFLNRLPANIGTNLVCLTMEDHYVRVYTVEGNALILMRMADAITELENYLGMRVHRSWWVANAAIQQINKEKRRHVIQLTSGLAVPVSQPYLAQLKGAGFL